jgi:hypothetical protein
VNNEHQEDARASQEYTFDTTAQPLKTWLTRRLKRNQRDAIDNLAKRLIADVRLPRAASKSLYEARMRQYGYSADDISVFLAAWQEYKSAELGD